MDDGSSNVSVACSYLHQGMMTKRSTRVFKGVMMTVFGWRIDRQGAFSTIITSVRVMLNTGILLPTSYGNVHPFSWFWWRMVYSWSQLGMSEAICCTLMNPEPLDEVAHSGGAMSWQENCRHKGKRGLAFPPPVAAVPEEPTAPFFRRKLPVVEAMSLRESIVCPAMAKRWVGRVDWKRVVYPEWAAPFELGESLWSWQQVERGEVTVDGYKVHIRTYIRMYKRALEGN